MGLVEIERMVAIQNDRFRISILFRFIFNLKLTKIIENEQRDDKNDCESLFRISIAIF